MKFILRLFQKNPIAFLISSLLTLLVVAAAVVSFAAIVFSITAPRILRDDFMEKTGFFMSGENIFANMFSREIEIDNLRISPPAEYKESDFFAASKIIMKVDCWEFLKGKIIIKEMSVDAQKLNCVKISASRYSTRDFVYAFPGFAEFAPKGDFKFFKISIDEIEYIDKSNPKMPLSWKSKEKFELEIGGGAKAGEAQKQAEQALEKAGAGFVLQGITL